jgi:hypothetical protein
MFQGLYRCFKGYLNLNVSGVYTDVSGGIDVSGVYTDVLGVIQMCQRLIGEHGIGLFLGIIIRVTRVFVL